jgi:hypothetical protein
MRLSVHAEVRLGNTILLDNFVMGSVIQSILYFKIRMIAIPVCSDIAALLIWSRRSQFGP